MTSKQFYDWQTLGGTDDVMRFVDALEKADIVWCAIGGVAVNHWAAEPIVTQDVDFVVAADSIERAETVLKKAGFKAETFEWSINFKGKSKVSIQLTTESSYKDFATRGVPADVHGILLQVSKTPYAEKYWHGAIRRDVRASVLRTLVILPAWLNLTHTFGKP